MARCYIITRSIQQASSPYLRRDIALVERLQRLATRMIKGMRELPYEDRLRRLNIFSLERRRLHGDLILAYNVFHCRLNLPQTEFFEASAARDLRGPALKLRHRRFRGDLILTYTIFHGRLNLPQAEFFEALAERNLRGPNFKLRHRSSHFLRRKAAFSVRFPISWNNLPIEIVNSPTPSFKLN